MKTYRALNEDNASPSNPLIAQAWGALALKINLGRSRF